MLPAFVNKFNRGEIAAESLSRLDVAKIRNSCSHLENFLPIRLGPMRFRPGFELINTVSQRSRMIPFVAATDDVAIIELSNGKMRVWVDDELVTRVNVTTTVENGIFATDLTGWNDADEVGALSDWDAGTMRLLGNGVAEAIRWQTLTTTQTGVEQALRFTIGGGPVKLQIGTGGASSTQIFEGFVGPGTHSLAFTPNGAVTVTFSSALDYNVRVDNVEIETAGVMELPISVTEANLPFVRYAQSADVVFVACSTSVAPFRIERRGTRSWSIVEWRVDDGPFGTVNATAITLTPGGLSGNRILTASKPFFKPGHVRALFKLVSTGQQVTDAVTTEDDGTGNIRVTGVSTTRAFQISVTGTFVATVTLQRSADEVTWESVETYTFPIIKTFNDTLDNSVLFYRLRVLPGNYTSGTANLTLSWPGGSIEGVCRVTTYNSSTSVDVQVLKAFGNTTATRDWYEGEWSAVNGYPSAVALYEGRVWLAGKNKVWASVSDAYTSYDTDIEGGSASIRRTIGFGPVDSVHWLAGAPRLLMGIASDEVSIRSSSFGEVLTPTNTNLRPGSNQGTAPISPVVIDDSVYFVQKSGIRVYRLQYDISQDGQSHMDLTTLHPSICKEGVVRLAFTRQPESRLFVVLANGEMRVYMFDPTEDVAAWSRITVDGLIEDVVTLPGDAEERIYAVVLRGTTRYLVKLALTDDCDCQHMDFFVAYTSPGTTLTGLGHLEGETVGVMADGEDRGDFVVSGGSITVPTAWTQVYVGLRYEATYVSNKLSDFGTEADAPAILGRRKRIVETGLIAKDFRQDAITVGPSTALLKPLPAIESGKNVEGQLFTDYDHLPFEFDDDTETDPRIHLKATGPCTIMALTYSVKDPSSPGAGK